MPPPNSPALPPPSVELPNSWPDGIVPAGQVSFVVAHICMHRHHSSFWQSNLMHHTWCCIRKSLSCPPQLLLRGWPLLNAIAVLAFSQAHSSELRAYRRGSKNNNSNGRSSLPLHLLLLRNQACLKIQAEMEAPALQSLLRLPRTKQEVAIIKILEALPLSEHPQGTPATPDCAAVLC